MFGIGGNALADAEVTSLPVGRPPPAVLVSNDAGFDTLRVRRRPGPPRPRATPAGRRRARRAHALRRCAQRRRRRRARRQQCRPFAGARARPARARDVLRVGLDARRVRDDEATDQSGDAPSLAVLASRPRARAGVVARSGATEEIETMNDVRGGVVRACSVTSGARAPHHARHQSAPPPLPPPPPPPPPPPRAP